MNKRIIAMAVVVLVGLSIFASTKTSEPLKNQETHAQASQESKPSETVNVPQEPQKPAEQPAIEPEKPVTWESNPNNCDQSKQYIAAEAPFNCIDKPIATVPVQQAPITNSGGGNCEAYRSLVSQYNWDIETMMYAMQKESSCNPNSIGDNYVINGVYAPSCGLLQVRTLTPSRGTCEELKDPAFNIQKSYEIWRSQGYSAWSVLR